MINPLDPGVLTDPFAVWAAQRADTPVFHDAASKTWIVLGYREAVEVLTSPAFSSHQGQQERGAAIAMPPSMLNTDGEQHVRLRAPAGRLLGPGAVRELVEAARPDLDAAVAGTPVTTETWRSLGHRCATVVFSHLLHLDGALTAEFMAVAPEASLAVRPGVTPEQGRRIGPAMPRLAALLRLSLERARSDSMLRAFADDDRLPVRDKVGVLMLAVIGGWEPLADLISNALPLLTAVRDDFVGTDRPEAFVDEFLRLHAPIPIVSRGVTENVRLGGHEISRGARVVVLLAAANRDPRVFDEPDTVRPGRDTPALAFGGGTHYCLGAGLVRAAATAAHTAILHHNPHLRLELASPPWEASLIPRRIAPPRFG